MSQDQLHHADCLDILPTLPTNSVHLVIADLPFATTQNKWDSLIDLPLLWKELKRITTPNAALLFFSQWPFSTTLATSNPKQLRYEWIWQKTQGTGFLNANKMPLKAHEQILVFYNKLPTYNPQKTPGKPYKQTQQHVGTNYRPLKGWVTNNTGDRYPTTVLTYPRDKPSLHPTQKPVPLLEYLIRTYTNDGDTILDPTAGSGSTLVAARNTNRTSIGIERDSDYFKIISDRMKKLK